MMLFRKKPVTIEAVQLCWKNWNEVCAFLGDIISPDNPGRSAETFSDTCGEVAVPYIEITIPTLEGDHVARHGDWIIKGVKGEFYPCKPDIFAATYAPATVNDPLTVAPSQAAADVLAERRRQIDAEGWTPEHDDGHAGGEIGRAAACYAAYHGTDAIQGMDIFPRLWPWNASWWKPRGPRENLVRAGALILAEIERLDRAAEQDESDRCIACGKPFKHGDLYLPDVSGDYLHAACCGPERESYCSDIGTGEPLGPDAPIPDPLVWRDERLDRQSGEG